VCHLPLCYGVPGAAQGSPDYTWAQLQKVMKEAIPSNANYWGKQPTKVNAEICHLVGTTMIPEITKPRLYQTPVFLDATFPPESGLYMYINDRRKRQHKLFQWDFDRLFPHRSTTRLLRAQNYLSLRGVNYFVACADCNMAHTGQHQLQAMFKRQYNKTDVRTKVEDVYAMYTMMFDCMADNFSTVPPTIDITARRQEFWQLELWLNYCTLMFMAQQHKEAVNTTKRLLGMDEPTYRFLHAHRDMGMCDFYMNQILAVILYVNYDIDVDFVGLHQNFLCMLPHIIHDHNKFETADIDYRCTWRWVMGDPKAALVFAARKDLNAENRRYHPSVDHVYWLSDSDLRNTAKLIQTKVMEFAESWLIPLGRIIDASRIAHPDYTYLPAFDVPLAMDMHNAFWTQCGNRERVRIEKAKIANIPPLQDCYVFHVMVNSSIADACAAFKDAKYPPENYHVVMFTNFITLAFRRTYAAYMLTNGGQAALASRWRKFVFAVRNFMQSLPP
jgi:hypothetical protein